MTVLSEIAMHHANRNSGGSQNLFSRHLGALLVARGLRNADLARRLGVDPALTAGLLSGKRPVPRPASVKRIAQGLELNEQETDELLTAARRGALQRLLAFSSSPTEITLIDRLIVGAGTWSQDCLGQIERALCQEQARAG